MKKLKVAISYPPLESKKGTPTLSQNRQFQWFSDPTYIYPVIPASAATLLKENGYDVFWDDAIAEGLSYSEWKKRLISEKPDLVAIETKTPVIKRHWQIINDLKNSKPARNASHKEAGGVEHQIINRELTKWKLYAYKNGNFKYTPGSYVMNGRDCWWGKCAFCSWTTMFPGKNFRVRSVEKALDEIGGLISLGVREIMEDCGTLPVG